MKTILENDQKRDRFSMFSVNGNDDFEDFNVLLQKQ